MTGLAVEQARERSLLAQELQDAWAVLSPEERLEGLRLLPHAEAEFFLLSLAARDQAELLLAMSPGERRSWMRLLPPDDAADVIQEAPDEERDSAARAARRADAEGGRRAARLRRGRRRRPDEPALRAAAAGHDASTRRSATCAARRASALETIYYVYVLDAEQRLLGVVSFRELFAAQPEKTRARRHAHRRRHRAARTWTRRRVAAVRGARLPRDAGRRRASGGMKGIVTVDDIVDVVQEEATEDIQKIGGMEALDAPYLEIGFWRHDPQARRLARRRSSSARC